MRWLGLVALGLGGSFWEDNTVRGKASLGELLQLAADIGSMQIGRSSLTDAQLAQLVRFLAFLGRFSAARGVFELRVFSTLGTGS